MLSSAVLFGSEPKTLLDHPLFKAKMDREKPFINVPMIKDIVEEKNPELTHVFNINPLERIIQINSGLRIIR
jgi:hypothetical protein